MPDSKGADKKLLEAWLQAGITHLEQVGTLGSLIQHSASNDPKTHIVTMIMKLPKPIADIIHREVEKVMDGILSAMLEAAREIHEDREEKAKSATKH